MSTLLPRADCIASAAALEDADDPNDPWTMAVSIARQTRALVGLIGEKRALKLIETAQSLLDAPAPVRPGPPTPPRWKFWRWEPTYNMDDDPHAKLFLGAIAGVVGLIGVAGLVVLAGWHM